MKIVAASPADGSIVAALEAACFGEPWAEETVSAALRDERYVVLLAREVGSTPIGYVLGWSIGEEAEFARVGVLPAWRGQGIGALLTRAILEIFQSRGAELVFLEVRESNFAAQRVYEKCGFVEVGRRANYYSNGETALVMRAEIN
jgi:ribosomal-protein-alanine N-acetyltransferase